MGSQRRSLEKKSQIKIGVSGTFHIMECTIKKKPGKIKVVFDCSALYHGFSLNQQLLQGPDHTNNLTGVLCRFGMERITFMCDIKAMFHQVKVDSSHRDYLRFLWWEEMRTLREIQSSIE